MPKILKLEKRESEISKSYNEFKEFEGKKYQGMKIGRRHNWNYDPGVWTEKKIEPDKWEINFSVKKHRKGHAPEGSGVPVGTEYHWYILAHQNVRKLNANIYSTALSGIKFKVAHKRSATGKWSTTEATQKKRIIRLLTEMIEQLKEQTTN